MDHADLESSPRSRQRRPGPSRQCTIAIKPGASRNGFVRVSTVQIVQHSVAIGVLTNGTKMQQLRFNTNQLAIASRNVSESIRWTIRG